MSFPVKASLIPALGLLLWSGPGFGAEPPPPAPDGKMATGRAAIKDFREMILEALDQNPKVKAAQARLDSAREKIPQSRAALMPDLSFNASASHKDTDWMGGRVKTDPEEAGFALTQPLFNWKAVVALQQTDPYVQAAAADVAATRQSTLLELTKTAIELLQAQEVAKLAQNNVTLTHRHLESTELRFKVGELTRTDVNQAQARYSSAEAELIRADNDVLVSRVRFLELAGMEPPAGLTLPSPALGRAEQAPVADMLNQRPDLHAARLRLDVAQKDVDLAKAGHLPTVNLTSSATRYADQEVGRKDPVDESLVKVELSLPLFSGGETFSKTREAVAAREAQRAEVERLRLQVVREIEQAQFEVKSSRASEQAFAAAVKANESALAGVSEEFKVGTRTALDLLDAQHESFTAQTDLARSRFRVVLARYQLLYAAGQLDPSVLWPDAPQKPAGAPPAPAQSSKKE